MSNSDGKNVAEYWCKLFELNETYFANPAMSVMDDDDIRAEMGRAFPMRRDNSVLKQVVRVRSRFNRGALTCQKGKRPEHPSYRYALQDAGGWRRVSARGHLLPENQQTPIALLPEEQGDTTD